MELIAQIVGTVLGFIVVMTAASLVVSIVVRFVHYLADKRSTSLSEMLGALNHGFRLHHGDRVSPGDAAENRFVLDILTDPALHSMEAARTFDAASAQLGDADDPRRKLLARRVDFISKESLLAIVERLSPQGVLPARWHYALAPEHATVNAFRDHLDKWFAIAEGNSTEQFRRDSKRLVVVLSALLVVVTNLDAIQLVTDLYHSAPLRDALANQANDLLQTASALGATDRAATANLPTDRVEWLNEGEIYLPQLNAVLNQPELNLGWTHSWIVRKWCKACGASTDPDLAEAALSPTWSDWFVTLVRWLAGLALSTGLLSLGAPFWADQLKSFLGVRNAVQQRLEKERS
jgi:hypothetical protein